MLALDALDGSHPPASRWNALGNPNSRLMPHLVPNSDFGPCLQCIRLRAKSKKYVTVAIDP
jgi:hypothetical protein